MISRGFDSYFDSYGSLESSSSIAAAAFSCISGRTCEYTSMVTETLEWPRTS